MTSLTGQALIIRADARVMPLPDASVDLIVTSPPYWAPRRYPDIPWGEIGIKAHWAERQEALL